MDLITTHVNADFDALSSLVAAGKIYPKARLLLPGSQEKSVRKFLALIKDEINIESEKTCRFDDVTRLVLVDNRHRSRIGAAADLLKKKGIKVHIYDHHPRTRFDIKADKDVHKEVGATVTLLLELLQKKKRLSLTPLEATLMLLGIYEETGSLSYSTTTKLDVDIVSRLLGMGASLNAVSSYLNRELDSSELTALIKLLEATEVAEINGIMVAFAQLDTSHLDGEMGTVVHKFQDVENYPVLFAMFKTADRIKIMARSRLEIINVNKLLSVIGGAGHSSAASARVVGRDFNEVKKLLKMLLHKAIQPEIFARDIMSFPVRTVAEDEKVRDVLNKLEDFGYNAAPVLNDHGEIVGIVTMDDLKKAIQRKMGHSRVKGYMEVVFSTVAPEAPLHQLKTIMTEKGKGCIPVLKENKLVGIITRTDVLKKVHHTLFEESENDAPHITNLSDRMKDVLPPKLMTLIRKIGKEADQNEMNAFLVGGFVRDILLKKKNFDLDVVVEGDAIKFGKVLADKLDASLVVHRKFGTSTVVMDWPSWLGPSLHLDNKFKIDIATARKETYERPAALPTVEFSSLRDDLYRRDFTINAMALSINKNKFGIFIDFFGGMKDLQKKIIRALHDKSFIDDPTRIFRAVRFEQRLGFKIEKHTDYLIQHAVKKEMFKWTENQRIRDELKLILNEKYPEKAILRMRELHELRFIHSSLKLKKGIDKTFSDLKKAVKWYQSSAIRVRKLDTWLMYFIVMLDSLTPKQVQNVLDKFVFTRGERIRISSFSKQSDSALKKLSSKRRLLPSEIFQVLEPFSHEGSLCLWAKSGSPLARRRIRRFFTEYNGTKLKIKGHDIEKLGISPGPKYRELLKRILCEKLDGKLPSKKDEMRFLRSIVGKGK